MTVKYGRLDHEQVWVHYAQGQVPAADRPDDGPPA